MPNKGTKLYNLILRKKRDGVNQIALVEDPAISSGWVAFSKDKGITTPYLFADKERQMLYGAVMIPNKQILRVDPVTEERFYVVFQQDTIDKMSAKFLAEGRANEFNLDHNPDTPAEVSITESWIKAEEDKANTLGLGDVPVGSWIVGAKVHDKELWDDVKEGRFTGFSLEGFFTEEQLFSNQFNNHIMSESKKNAFTIMRDGLADLLKKFEGDDVNETPENSEEQKLAIVELPLLDGGVIFWDDETQEIFGATEEGTQGEPLGDGSYELADGRIIEVAGGVVANVTEPEVAEKEAMAKALELMGEKIVELQSAREADKAEFEKALAELTSRIDTFGAETPKKKFSKSKPEGDGYVPTKTPRKFN